MKHACHHGCIANAQNNSGDPLGNNGECEYRKLQ
jgi:MoaA/NifB/PqqE/SkfB family radical SAM enzyme